MHKNYQFRKIKLQFFFEKFNFIFQQKLRVQIGVYHLVNITKVSQVMTIDSDYFDPSSVFAKLTQEEMDILNYKTICNSYKAGTIIFHERHNIGGIYYVQEGIVKMYKTGVNGREKIIRFAQKGEIFGFRSVLCNELADTTAKVIEGADICFINAQVFKKLIKENSNFSMEVLRVSLKELREANKFIIDIAQKTVRERLAEILLLLKDKFKLDENKYLQVRLSREELANLVGTATESVIRLLSEFKHDKYIELNGRKIKILKVEALKKLAKLK